MKNHARALWFCAFLAAWVGSQNTVSALNVQRLEDAEIQTLQEILKTLEPEIATRKQNSTAVLLTWEELTAKLSEPQRAFIQDFRALRAENLGATSHFFGLPSQPLDLVAVGSQSVNKNGAATPLDPQYLPQAVADAYERMMKAMEADLGRRLLVESGYRSAAYQLYLFLYYLSNHDYSITETNRFVALPGYSEHGNPNRQAIDFINQDGINGEDNPEEFEALAEYRWLQAHAQEYGFFLSYPRDNPHNTAFEPWHWHFEVATRKNND